MKRGFFIVMDRENRPKSDSGTLINRDVPLEVLARSMRVRAQTIAGIESEEDDPIDQYLNEAETVDYPAIGRRLLLSISSIEPQIIPDIVSEELGIAGKALVDRTTDGVPSNEARIIDIIQREVTRAKEQVPGKVYAYKPSEDQNSQIGLPLDTRGRVV